MSRLTYEQRYTIELLLNQGVSKKEISKTISVNKTVVYRELQRNSDVRNGVCKSKLAQSKYENRLSLKPKRIKLTSDLKSLIIEMVNENFSPVQISWN
jgi:IS30 family transposase